MAMNKNTMIVLAVVVVLAAAVIVAAVFLLPGKDITKDATDMETSELKVFGNINGDGVIDQKDIDIIQKLIDDGKAVTDYPAADANQDKKIDSKDIDLVKKIIAGESCTIWHINLHDTDGDGKMDYETVSTKFPINSIICTGSSNTFMMLYLCDVVDEVKGASYGSTIDNIFKDNYKNEEKVKKLGTSSTSIAFEDGKGAASELIKEKNVTMVLSDWNRTYLTNEADFEKAGVDVVRIAAASTDINTVAHNSNLLGLLFQKQKRAAEVTEYMKEVFDKIDKKMAKEGGVTAVVSSMTNYYSVGDSDYNAVAKYAGATIALDKGDWGTTTSIKVMDNLIVFNPDEYKYDYIIHLRAYNGYTNEANLPELYDTYTKDIAKYWEHGTDGQYIVNGNMPIPCRIAYAMVCFYDDVDKAWADEIHQGFVDKFFEGSYDVSKLSFFYPIEA